jgi:hypothetical protein
MMEHLPYTFSEAEIKRLERKVSDLTRDCVYGHNAEIERLKALCSLAADALEFWMKDLSSTEQQYVDAAMRDERLLAELRKAAQ